MNLTVVLDTFDDPAAHWPYVVSRAGPGFWIGFSRAARPASFLSYAFAETISSTPNTFGHGDLEGVVGAGDGLARRWRRLMLPMIRSHPGSPTAAVMLWGLIIWGLHRTAALHLEA